MSKERYENLDGLRAYACVGIVLMHVLSNMNLRLTGFVYESFIPSLTHFVSFFLLVSAFSLCCGRKNLIYVAMFFVAGGLIYLYREQINNSPKVFHMIDGAVLIGSMIVYYTIAQSIFIILITFITLTILAILRGGIQQNSFFRTKLHALSVQ